MENSTLKAKVLQRLINAGCNTTEATQMVTAHFDKVAYWKTPARIANALVACFQA